MEKQILSILKENRHTFISGEDISRQLKISRTAVWKHIQKLKENGYEFIAQPHFGYKLTGIPDKILADEVQFELGTTLIGTNVLAYASTASTNDLAYTLAEQGMRDGTLVVSEEQTKGKGRLGRSWISPRSKGIYMSLILHPEISPVEAGKITLLAAVSVAKAIKEYARMEPQIKWPNDVYIDGKKVCGILTEMSAEQDLIKFIVLGIGINVNGEETNFPEGATSLKAKSGRQICRVEFLKVILRNIEKRYFEMLEKNFFRVTEEFKNLSMTLGKMVKVACKDQVLEGYAADIDDNGALIIRDETGFLKSILSGDVTLLR